MNSQFYRTIADLLELIESLGVASDQYGILDGGGTLEPTFRTLHCHNRFSRNFGNSIGHFLYTEVRN